MNTQLIALSLFAVTVFTVLSYPEFRAERPSPTGVASQPPAAKPAVNGAPNAAQWQGLFAHTGFKLATLLALVATAYHGLVGALHVWPDYVKNRAVLAVLNAYTWVVAGAVVLWSVYILFGSK